MDKIKPELIDILRPFPARRSGEEWAVEYEVVIGNALKREFKLTKLRSFPQEIGYRFWLLARSKGFNQVDDDISQADLNKALVLQSDDATAVNTYIRQELEGVGEVDWDTLVSRLAAFLDVDDVEDDGRDRSSH